MDGGTIVEVVGIGMIRGGLNYGGGRIGSVHRQPLLCCLYLPRVAAHRSASKSFCFCRFAFLCTFCSFTCNS